MPKRLQPLTLLLRRNAPLCHWWPHSLTAALRRPALASSPQRIYQRINQSSPRYRPIADRRALGFCAFGSAWSRRLLVEITRDSARDGQRPGARCVCLWEEGCKGCWGCPACAKLAPTGIGSDMHEHSKMRLAWLLARAHCKPSLPPARRPLLLPPLLPCRPARGAAARGPAPREV